MDKDELNTRLQECRRYGHDYGRGVDDDGMNIMPPHPALGETQECGNCGIKRTLRGNGLEYTMPAFGRYL